jgi:hypothetical protein
MGTPIAIRGEFDSARIPVDSAVLLRTPGREDYELCHVLNVGATALHAVLTHTLPLNTMVSLAVGDGSSCDRLCRVTGKVRHRERMGDRWLHVISAPAGGASWSEEFLYDVLCSSAEDGDELMASCNSSVGYVAQAAPAAVAGLQA